MAYGNYGLFPGSIPLKDLTTARGWRYHWRDNGPVITTCIGLVCIAIWIIEFFLWLVSKPALNSLLALNTFIPAYAISQPWTALLAMFTHQPSSITHILFNMLTLWALGPLLERMMGHWPFLVLYLLSGFGGHVGMLLWAVIDPSGSGWLTGAYGASGALFGLFAAIFVVYRRIGMDITSLLVWLGLNLIMPFLTPGIAWQAHVSGFIVGGIFTYALVSGFRQLRGKSLAYRSAVYGGLTFGVLVLLYVVLGLQNPWIGFLF